MTCKEYVTNTMYLWLCSLRHTESIRGPHKNCPRATCGPYVSVWTTLC